jgi:hypothetical protein
MEVEATGVAGAAAVLAVLGDVVGVDLEQARKLPAHMRMNAKNDKRKRVMIILLFRKSQKLR